MAGQKGVIKSPVAEEVAFDPTGTGFDPSVESVDDALRQIDTLDLETLTEFEAFESESNQTTTSNGWVTKSGYPFTSAAKEAGRFVIDHTAEVGNSDKEKQTGHRVQWRPGTAGSWQTLVDIRNAVSVDGRTELRTGFNIIDLPSDGPFQVRIQFGQTDDGGTGTIRNANIKIGRVGD